MKIPIVPLILTIFFSVILYLAGLHFYRDLTTLFTPQVNGAVFFVLDEDYFIWDARLMAAVFALIPVSSFLLWHFSPIISVNRRILSILLIIACMSFGVFMRGKYIRSQIIRSVESRRDINRLRDISKDPFTLEDLNFKRYLFIGLLFGAGISFFSFRQKSSINQDKKRRGNRAGPAKRH